MKIYSEFFNNKVRNVFINYGINHYKTPTKTKWKAAFAERVIRTIKTRIQKYFYKHNTRNWIDVIDQIVDNYNHTPHSSHGLPPLEVTMENHKQVYKKLYPYVGLKTICRLNVGDKVRILIEKKEFEKGYLQNWSDQVYIITKKLQQYSVCWYYLSELNVRVLLTETI